MPREVEHPFHPKHNLLVHAMAAKMSPRYVMRDGDASLEILSFLVPRYKRKTKEEEKSCSNSNLFYANEDDAWQDSQAGRAVLSIDTKDESEKEKKSDLEGFSLVEVDKRIAHVRGRSFRG
ncbi:hypothetical protein Q3G72_006716 [Acer saccharum]|nr:hypothetical protein Q3G72_006716 [Acer saccharum]